MRGSDSRQRRTSTTSRRRCEPIEQGRYLVRAANTGISGIVDPYGRVVARTALFERAVVTGDVRLLTTRTIYGRMGDLFASLCVVVTLTALLGGWGVGRVRRVG